MAQNPWIELDTPGQLTANPWQLKPEGQLGSVRELVVKVPSGQGADTTMDVERKRERKVGSE